MPGFHKHKGKNSYYFVPKRHGDFHTYQLEDEARDMVLATGKANGDIVSWDIFYTLNDLGLLYFKESDKDPRDTAPDPSAVDFDIVSELSVEKRCAFVERVLSHYELHQINSDAFHRVVASLDEASFDELKPVLADILATTPVDESELSPINYMLHAGTDAPVDEVTVAVILHYLYEEYRNEAHAKNLAEAYNGEPAYMGSRYVYYIVESGVWDADDKTYETTINLPDPYHDPLQADEYGHDELLDLFESLSIDALRDAAEDGSPLLTTLLAGLSKTDETTLLIVPLECAGKSVEQLSENIASDIVDSLGELDAMDELTT